LIGSYTFNLKAYDLRCGNAHTKMWELI